MSVIVGLDLGGNTNNNVTTLVPKIKGVLHHALRPKDRFRLVVAGDNAVNDVSGWRQADSVSIDTVLGNFAASALADSISKEKKPKIVFCDEHALEIWDYPSLSKVAVIDTFNNIVDAAGSFSTADVVASYNHGYESATLTDQNLSMLFPRIDSLFARGGRFLGYFDHNRPEGDSIEPHYVHGLAENYPATNQTVYAQPNGNIGNQFPPSILLNSVNYLTYNDPNAKSELANSNGQPVVISKHVGNGLLVVSGVWAFEDDGALKQTMAVALLGISQFKQGRQLLEPMLDHIGTELNQTTVNEVFVFSNADSVVSRNDASIWVTDYLAEITGSKPVFQTINLLDGTTYVPSYVSENGVEYYGAGYITYLLSQATSGLHFETHLKSWDLISGSLTYSYFAKMDSLNVSVTADGGREKLIGMREVDPEPNEPAKPRFFIGVSNALQKVTFDVTASFQGTTKTAQMQDTSYISIDTTRKVPTIAEMLGSEQLNDIFNASSNDTSAIVNLAMKYNLLCNYTSLIALEPNTDQPAANDNYNGNGGGGSTAVKKTSQEPDTVEFSAYPNPFNPTTTFYFSLRAPSDITIVIYDLLGQVVRTMTLSSGPGTTTIVWDGRDAEGRTVASGVYFAKAIIVEKSTRKMIQRSVKLLMLK